MRAHATGHTGTDDHPNPSQSGGVRRCGTQATAQPHDRPNQPQADRNRHFVAPTTAQPGNHDRPSPAQADRISRFGALAAAAAVTCAAGLAFAPGVDAATSTPPARENAAARAAILESVSAQPDPSVVPEDFVQEFGYRPVIESGMLLDPHGDCSSPVPLPREFDRACEAHDFGYDLLRYATAHGQPLGPWARRTADAALQRRMHAACATRDDTLRRAGCQMMADVAATAVDLNSVRQGYGDPVYEPFVEPRDGLPSPATVLFVGVGIIAGLGTATMVLVRRARSRPAFGPKRSGRSDVAGAAVAR